MVPSVNAGPRKTGLVNAHITGLLLKLVPWLGLLQRSAGSGDHRTELIVCCLQLFKTCIGKPQVRLNYLAF